MGNRELGEKGEGKNMFNYKKLWVVIGLALVAVCAALIMINADISDEPETQPISTEPLTFQEAKQLKAILSERFSVIYEKDNKSTEETELVENYVGLGIAKDNVVTFDILDDSEEVIALYWKYILDGADNAETVVFQKSAPSEPASSQNSGATVEEHIDDYEDLNVTVHATLIDRDIPYSLKLVLQPGYEGKYMPSEVAEALIEGNDEILSDLELPRSMDIEIPNLDGTKILETKPIIEYGNPADSTFIKELKLHGYSEEVIKQLNYEDYRLLENSWLMTKEHQEVAISLYPELSKIDISEWTIGEFLEYYTTVDSKRFIARISPEHKAAYEQRGIRLEDVKWLSKEFHSHDNALKQSDETLKEIIAGYYQFRIDRVYAMANDYECDELYDKASKIYAWFDIGTLDSAGPSIDIDGLTYFRVIGPITSYQELVELMESVFADRIVEELLFWNTYIDIDGVLYGIQADRGTDQTKGKEHGQAVWEVEVLKIKL